MANGSDRKLMTSFNHNNEIFKFPFMIPFYSQWGNSSQRSLYL